jgi:hypothetical protein
VRLVGALKPAQDAQAPGGAAWGAAAAAAARSAAGDGFDRPTARPAAGVLPPSLARGIAQLDAPDEEEEDGGGGAHIPDADAIRCAARVRTLAFVCFFRARSVARVFERLCADASRRGSHRACRRAKEKRERARFIHSRAGDFVPLSSGAPPSSTQRHAGGGAPGGAPARAGGDDSDASGSDEDVRLCVPARHGCARRASLRCCRAHLPLLHRIALFCASVSALACL